MIPTDPKLTKLRLLANRARGEMEAAQGRARAAGRIYEKAWLEYVKACKAAGYCAFCERPLDECKCIFMAEAA